MEADSKAAQQVSFELIMVGSDLVQGDIDVCLQLHRCSFRSTRLMGITTIREWGKVMIAMPTYKYWVQVDMFRKKNTREKEVSRYLTYSAYSGASPRSFVWRGTDSWAPKPTYPKNLVSPRISINLF